MTANFVGNCGCGGDGMAELRKCRLFTCNKRRGNYCCRDCDRNDRCKGACKNDPDKCGMAFVPIATQCEDEGENK